MSKLDKNSLDNFMSVLEGVDASWQTEFNLREVVRESYHLIKRARGYKVSWERIAEVLQQSCEGDQSFSPVTIRQYFFEISKNPAEQPRSKRKSKSSQKSKGKPIRSSNTHQVVPVEASPGSPSADSAISNLQNSSELNEDNASKAKDTTSKYVSKDDIKSQFNL